MFDFVTVAAWAFAAILALLLMLQFALALGAPLGHFAWGGQHRTLPVALRISSVLSIIIYVAVGLLVLDHANIIDLLPVAFTGVAIWVVFIYLALGVVMNGFSRSRHERYTMTPVALVLASLTLVVALS